ncbi:MAG: hypothetical protein H8Z69_05660 [Nanohaloarchaea archaeon]|nr:hypothetical protein [Candidatus Nanohaloarchaea archaeon]
MSEQDIFNVTEVKLAGGLGFSGSWIETPGGGNLLGWDAVNMQLDLKSGDIDLNGNTILDSSGNIGLGSSIDLSGNSLLDSSDNKLNLEDNVKLENQNYIQIGNDDGSYYLGGGSTPDAETTGVHLEAGSNPSSGNPIFIVESSGGSERLRVEHSGTTSTSNSFRADGGISSGGTLNMNNNRIDNVGTPSDSDDAATKGYVDSKSSGSLQITGTHYSSSSACSTSSDGTSASTSTTVSCQDSEAFVIAQGAHKSVGTSTANYIDCPLYEANAKKSNIDLDWENRPSKTSYSASASGSGDNVDIEIVAKVVCGKYS